MRTGRLSSDDNIKISRDELATLTDCIHDIVAQHILWIGNEEKTFVKDILLRIVRERVPHHIKQAIAKSFINPVEYQHYDEIKNIDIKVSMPDGNTSIMKFSELYSTYFLNTKYDDKFKFHKNGNPFSYLERLERSSRATALFSGGNCGECADIGVIAWLECNKEALKKFGCGLENLSFAPFQERVHFVPGTEVVDHAFNICNRPASSNLQDVSDWIKNGDEVTLIDYWYERSEIISVNEQLALPISERTPYFEWLREVLESGKSTLKVDCRVKLGQGHSPRWQAKARDNEFFVNRHPTFNFHQKPTYQTYEKFLSSFAMFSDTKEWDSNNNEPPTADSEFGPIRSSHQYARAGRDRPY